MKTLVLIGGGHAHLHCLEQFNKHSFKDWRVLLISPSVHQYYSGMFSGYIEELYTLNDMRVDLERLCEKIGAAFIEDRIDAVDTDSKQLTGAQGAVYRYDLASFDIGSTTVVPESLAEQIPALKPNYHFPEQLRQIRETRSPVIAGGGASGVEIAFSIHSWRKHRQFGLNSVLVSSSALLSGQGSRISKSIEAIANRKALPFYTGEKVDKMNDRKIITHTGKSFPKSGILWLTGPGSNPLFATSGIQTDEAGFLLVNDQLQSLDHPDIFGAGDCISFKSDSSLPKNGVFAVRQGPVLWHNLKNCMFSGKLIPFIPPKRFLAILSTGGGEAFLTYGKFHLHGKIPWRIKQSIDRKFLMRYKKIYV